MTALEAAARAAANAMFDQLSTAWHEEHERDRFIEQTWRGKLPEARAAIIAYLRATAERGDVPQPALLRLVDELG